MCSYRLNVFGFPAAAGSLRNPGLSDIRLAAEWVRDNIAGFGWVSPHDTLWELTVLHAETKLLEETLRV